MEYDRIMNHPACQARLNHKENLSKTVKSFSLLEGDYNPESQMKQMIEIINFFGSRKCPFPTLT